MAAGPQNVLFALFHCASLCVWPTTRSGGPYPTPAQLESFSLIESCPLEGNWSEWPPHSTGRLDTSRVAGWRTILEFCSAPRKGPLFQLNWRLRVGARSELSSSWKLVVAHQLAIGPPGHVFGSWREPNEPEARIDTLRRSMKSPQCRQRRADFVQIWARNLHRSRPPPMIIMINDEYLQQHACKHTRPTGRPTTLVGFSAGSFAQKRTQTSARWRRAQQINWSVKLVELSPCSVEHGPD